jgi:hypothetical protein
MRITLFLGLGLFLLVVSLLRVLTLRVLLLRLLRLSQLPTLDALPLGGPSSATLTPSGKGLADVNELGEAPFGFPSNLFPSIEIISLPMCKLILIVVNCSYIILHNFFSNTKNFVRPNIV